MRNDRYYKDRILCKLTHDAATHNTVPQVKFKRTGRYRNLTISNNGGGQRIHIFGEGLAIYPLSIGIQNNASEGKFS
jgi:hypothetical protein